MREKLRKNVITNASHFFPSILLHPLISLSFCMSEFVLLASVLVNVNFVDCRKHDGMLCGSIPGENVFLGVLCYLDWK